MFIVKYIEDGVNEAIIHRIADFKEWLEQHNSVREEPELANEFTLNPTPYFNKALKSILDKLDLIPYDKLTDYEKGLKDMLNYLFEREHWTQSDIENIINNIK